MLAFHRRGDPEIHIERIIRVGHMPDNDAGQAWLDGQAASEEPRLVESSEPTVGPSLQAAPEGFSAVLVAPVRDPKILFGMAMLYYAGDMPLPDARRVVHHGNA